MNRIFDAPRVSAMLIGNFVMAMLVFHGNQRSLRLIQTSPGEIIAKKAHFYSLGFTRIFILSCIAFTLYVLFVEGVTVLLRQTSLFAAEKDHV